MPNLMTSIELVVLVALTAGNSAMAEDNYSLDGDNFVNQVKNSTELNLDSVDKSEEMTNDLELVSPIVTNRSVDTSVEMSSDNLGKNGPQTVLPTGVPDKINNQVLPPSSMPISDLSGDGSAAPIKNGGTSEVNEFGGVPSLPGTKRNLAPGEAPEFYLVEDGDTMFDVCSQLIDDGNYWPKLWSLNPDVRNPHFIFPGMKLAFYSGDSDSPPFMEVVSEDEIVPVEKGGLAETELVSDTSVSIANGSEGGSVKVLQSIDDPSPVPIVGPGDINAESDAQDGVIYTGRYSPADDLSFTIPAFYFAEDIQSLGEVVSGVSGQRLIGDERKVYIKTENDLRPGVYTVLRKTGRVSSLVSDDEIGFRYEFAGHIRVLRKNSSGLMEASVFESRTGLQAEDVVVNFMSTHRRVNNISSSGPVATARSSVIGFAESGQRTGGKGDIIFLEKSGLSVGGFYSIFGAYHYRDIRHLRDDASVDALPLIGIARVIEITGESAIGVIIEGNSEVRVGDTLFVR